ncbi:3'(2'),5'-bisphosphate nucleotidase CysQ [Sphingomonas sp.]|uniref:3'(2'),5'-bisphosphate nucleotidase CysQ n=1 Tax=Sphingomonas sp. TaxID=28214 RepID=UPI002DD642C3|nr:3'(2'),5'-bisphosphate nucleotidase CysQ [Sphingomonas sp.]
MPDLPAVVAAAQEAGRLAMRRWDEGFDSWEKSPGHPVCAVDLEVDALLRDRLAAIDPDAGWLSEETADDAVRLEKRRVWVVDPIDGTRDYIRRRIGWCVSVALVEDGRPVLAVLDAPARDELWTAAAGQGAWRNGVALKVSARTQLAGARAPTDSLPREDRDLLVVAKPNSIALRIAMVAADEADLLATLRWGSEWDVAAAVLVAQEAGATVTDAFGQPLAFNTPSAKAFGVLATAPGIHAAAVDRLAARARAAAG